MINPSNTYFFKEGDMVTIKSWSEMEKEYGTFFGNICTPCRFRRDMESLCGYSFIIKGITNSHSNRFGKYQTFLFKRRYFIDNWMLKPYKRTEFMTFKEKLKVELL